MTKIDRPKANLSEENRIAGEMADGTTQPYGTPPKRKNKMRATKLLKNTTSPFPNKPRKNI